MSAAGRRVLGRAVVVWIGLLTLAVSQSASAVCNVIPAAMGVFRGGLGATSTPYASPGDRVEVRVRPDVCDGASTGFVDVDLDGDARDDHIVTLIFTPPQGPANAVVLANDCGDVPASELTACEGDLGVGGTATCLPAGPSELVAPSTSRLAFRFPDTDTLVGVGGDGITYAGPAKIVVGRRGAPLQCGLATTRCADLSGDTATTGVVACVDELYERDGTCRTSPLLADPVFGHFTALPPPNDLEDMITIPGSTTVHFTTDAAGNALIPMDYARVLLRIDGIPVPQLARGASSVDAFTSSPGTPIAIPGDGFVGSYSPEGIVLPPVFTPLADPSGSDPTLFGSVDAPRGIIRIARQGCVGGDDEGAPCSDNGDCSQNVCSAPLFDFSDRYTEAGVGPVSLVGAAGEYTAVRDDPVPIAALAEGEESFVFPVLEGVDAQDRNGDGDALDPVVTIRDRETGAVLPIGPLGSDARAVTQIRQEGFRYPAIETDGEVVAFLESEPFQGVQDLPLEQDANANGNVFDPILRVYRVTPGSVAELTNPSSPLTIDGGPVVDRRSVAVSGDDVYFLTPEAALAQQVTERVSVDSFGGEGNGDSYNPSLSNDGLRVSFGSQASNLIATDTNGTNRDIFLHDRVSGVTQVVSVDSNGVQANNASAGHLSGDGNHVAMMAGGNAMTPDAIGQQPGTFQYFVHDLLTGLTPRISVDSSGVSLAGQYRGFHGISDDGRVVSFSASPDLLPSDLNGFRDVYLHDRDADEDLVFDEQTEIGGISTEILSLDDAGGQPADGNSGDSIASSPNAMAADGSRVAFQSASRTLDVTFTGTYPLLGSQSFVRDRTTGTTRLVSIGFDGNAASGSATRPSMSSDGRYVGFQSGANNLVPGATGGHFVRDLERGRTFVGSATWLGEAVTVNHATLSGSGRFSVFTTADDDVVPGDTNLERDVFLRDHVTGETARVSVSTLGAEADFGAVNNPHGTVIGTWLDISEDGRTVAFASNATNLVPGDTNYVGLDPETGDRTGEDVFVRGPDPLDLSADLSGDGDVFDTVLRVLDAGTGTVSDLCPARSLVVEAGTVAFLRPESAGPSAAADCLQPSALLNGDADEEDDVVHLWDGVAVTNLRCAATDLALSDTRLAALISEAGEGAELNGDADAVADDEVLHVRAPTAAGAGADCGTSGWINTQQAADALAVAGDLVVVAVPEAAQGGVSLNGDPDADDRVLRLVDGTTGALIPLVDDQLVPLADSPAVEEFVVGSSLLAFRTSEAAEDGQILNGDGDSDDAVLRIVDLATGELIETGESAVPCSLVACDPRRPYRVMADTVRYLQLEAQEGEDGNGDGDQLDLLVKLFNVRDGEAKVIGEVLDPGGDSGSDPLGDDEEDGDAESEILLSTGRCADVGAQNCGADTSACPSGEFCMDNGAGILRCAEAEGTCTTDTDCADGFLCIPDPVVIGVTDSDQDQIPEGIDNCPTIANTDQADADGDGAGDVCDRQTCGNGITELDEACDDTNLVDGDGCDSNCTLTGCGNGIVTEGEICDDGNTLPGDGCAATCALADGGLLSGRKLLVIDRATDASKRKVVLASRDTKVAVPAKDGLGDPTLHGATLTVYNPTTTEMDVVPLPSSGWTALGKPAGAKGYRYRGAGTAGDPCRRVIVLAGRAVNAVCKGAGLGFTLDEQPSQGGLAVALDLGSDQRLCLDFGGRIRKDQDVTQTGSGTGKFLALEAPAPPACAVP